LNQIKMNGAVRRQRHQLRLRGEFTASDALQLNGNNQLRGTAPATPGGCTGTVCSSLQIR
jgi:hypothetical protein